MTNSAENNSDQDEQTKRENLSQTSQQEESKSNVNENTEIAQNRSTLIKIEHKPSHPALLVGKKRCRKWSRRWVQVP